MCANDEDVMAALQPNMTGLWLRLSDYQLVLITVGNIFVALPHMGAISSICQRITQQTMWSKQFNDQCLSRHTTRM